MTKVRNEKFAAAAKRLQEERYKDDNTLSALLLHSSVLRDMNADASSASTVNVPQYQTYDSSDEFLDVMTKRKRRDNSGFTQPNTILSPNNLQKEIRRIPHGYTIDELLEMFAVAHPDKVVKHARTGVVRICQYDVPMFNRFVKELERGKITEQLKHSLTADAILQEYLFDKDISSHRLEKMICKFAKQNPSAVVPTSKIVNLDNGMIRRHKVHAIDRSCLQDFFKFADLKPIVENEMPVQKIKQPEIDPSAPGYKPDPTLQTISDQDMDIIASRLAEQDIPDVNAADDAIFAEIQKIATVKDDR